MTDLLVLDLVDKGLVTDQMVLTVGYDIENLTTQRGGQGITAQSRKIPMGGKFPNRRMALSTSTVTHHLRAK